MRLLLDTHTLLWWAFDAPQLSATARAHIADPAAECWVSVASMWEMAIKVSLGKLHIEGGLEAFVQGQLVSQRFRPLPITMPHALRVVDLPWHHRDPFDRLLVAQCQIEGLTLVSADQTLSAYELHRVW